MAIHNYEHDYMLAKKRLLNADISEKNKQLIQSYTNDKALQNISKPRLIKYLIVLKAVAVIMNKDLDTADKSVDSLTKSNRAVLMNPIFASDSKEQNLVLAPSHDAMKALSKGLEEFGGKVRLKHSDVMENGRVSDKKVQEFIDKVPKKKLLDAMQRMKLN